MNKQETIASLAAELTRIGKMPWWIEQHNDAFALCQMGVNDESFIEIEEAVLSALLGVAAEVIADYGGSIYNAGVVYKWCVLDNMENQIGKSLESYPEAVIAALKQVEKEKVK